MVYPLFYSSLGDLRRNKVRTFLTSLGILIGVFSVVALLALGVGFKIFIKQQFESLGTNLIIVFPGQLLNEEGNFQDSEGGIGSITFEQQDADKLSRIAEAEYVVPTYLKTAAVEYANEKELGDIFASPTEIFTIRKLEPQAGKLFTKGDESKRNKIAVLGPKLAEKLFKNSQNAVGKNIKINNQRFMVIGVLKPKGGGGFGGPDFDSFIYMPPTAARVFNPSQEFHAIYIQAKSETVIPELKERVKEVLLRKYETDDFSVIEQTEIMATVNSIFSMITLVLVAIGAISLIVGGIGIMNIMYASVTERTKEIGIRRALGATRSNILLQFLTEAVILSIFGGLLGLILAMMGVVIVQRWFPAQITGTAVALAVGVSTGVGVIFGVFPARSAAKLPPIEAIRKR